MGTSKNRNSIEVSWHGIADSPIFANSSMAVDKLRLSHKISLHTVFPCQQIDVKIISTNPIDRTRKPTQHHQYFLTIAHHTRKTFLFIVSIATIFHNNRICLIEAFKKCSWSGILIGQIILSISTYHRVSSSACFQVQESAVSQPKHNIHHGRCNPIRRTALY